MFDQQKAKQLEKQSHVRGMLSKQFFFTEQNQLQKKRRQMKRILDQQVQQRRRIKQKQKQQLQMRQRKEQEEIKKYHAQVVQRDRRLTDNNSNVNNGQSNVKNKNISHKNHEHNQSRVKQFYNQNIKQRSNSKSTLQNYDPGDIPLLPLMAFSDGPHINYQAHNNYNNHNNSINFMDNDKSNLGNILLLDLSQQSNFVKNKKKNKGQVKKSDRQNIQASSGHVISSLKFQQSRNTYSLNQNSSQNHNLSIENRHQRKKTFSDQQNPSIVQNIINSRMSKVSKNHQFNQNISPSLTKRQTQIQIPEQIEQIQNQNKLLKSQLKKNQQAISLLIGAVRSNAKLDKFRIQAQKILRSTQNQSKVHVIQEKKNQSPILLPKIKVKHQSIMHDYLIQAAKKAKLKKNHIVY